MVRIDEIEISDTNLFSVVYDIQRPWNKHWSKIAQKPKSELTPEEKNELERRRKWDRLIGEFVGKLERIGQRINWSVFLIPEKNYKMAKNIVDYYTNVFNNLNVYNDIYILRYHKESNEALITRLVRNLEIKTLKIIKQMDENRDKPAKIKALKKEMLIILDLAKSFGVEKNVLEYYKRLLDKYNLSSPKYHVGGSRQTLLNL